MSTRLTKTFSDLKESGKSAFVAYVAAGDPNFDASLQIMHALSRAGADVIELGVPFSDPLADGIVNQLAAERALKAGMNVSRVLDLIRAFREESETPLVLFTYLNPIYTYGYEKFHKDASAAGADGILLLDLPPDEAALNPDLTSEVGLHHIRLIAPATPESRVKTIAENSSGFIYALSRTGVTGAQAAPSATVGATVERIKQFTNTPVCVGFGISTPEQASEVAAAADGIIVGSAIVNQVAEHQSDPNLDQIIEDFVRPIVEACKSV